MMNANEARKNVEDYNDKVIKAREDRINRFLETTINAKIEENSCNGYNTCRVTGFADKKDTELVINKLEELGYEVEQIHGCLIIEW